MHFFRIKIDELVQNGANVAGYDDLYELTGEQRCSSRLKNEDRRKLEEIIQRLKALIGIGNSGR